MLEKFQAIKTAKRFYWLNASPSKLKSILTENVLNQKKHNQKNYKLRVTTAILFR